MKRSPLLLCVLLLASCSSHAEQLHGRIVGVLDGDTVDLLTDELKQVRIRLCQIDAPEKSQPYGMASKRSLSDMAYNQQATVDVLDHDRYGRSVGCITVNGTDVNREQLRRGMAWVYTQYARDADLAGIQAEAHAAGRGLWADPAPVPPWEYRDGNAS